MSEPNPYESPQHSVAGRDVDSRLDSLKFWERNPGMLAVVSFGSLFVSFSISATSFVPPRPLLPDVVAGVLFLASIVCGVLAIRGFASRRRKR